MARLKTNNDRFDALTDGQNHINRCIQIGESLRDWELECLEQSDLCTTNYPGPVTLLEICKTHGYGFFNICMQFWVSCLLLYATTWVSYRNITLGVHPDQLPSLPAWMRLPDIPEWMNPRLMASNIVSCAPYYFERDAGFWGPQSASFPMGAALHYLAATGGAESEEINQLKRLMKHSKLGGVTGNFLQSIANTADSTKGDPREREQHVKMATSWYGMNAIRRDRASSSSE
jgi:hypothetical protein